MILLQPVMSHKGYFWRDEMGIKTTH